MSESTLTSSIVRGAAAGAAVALPLGVGAGFFIRSVLYGSERSGPAVAIVILVAAIFCVWGAFIGAMVSAHRRSV